jgi:hypothetical protein
MRHFYLIARVLLLALVVASFVARAKGIVPLGFSTGS